MSITGHEWWIYDQTRIFDLPDMMQKDLWLMEMCYLIVNEKFEYNLVMKSNLEVKAKGSLLSSLEGMPLPSSKFDAHSIYSVSIDFASKMAIVMTTGELFVQILNSRVMVKLRPGDGLSSSIEDTKVCLMDAEVRQTPDFYRFIAVHMNSLDFVTCELNPSLPKFTSKVINFTSSILTAAMFRVLYIMT